MEGLLKRNFYDKNTPKDIPQNFLTSSINNNFNCMNYMFKLSILILMAMA